MSRLRKKVGLSGVTKISLVAAIYVVLTVSFGDLAYGPIQARPSELLNFLAFIDPYYIPGLVIGCAISNFYSFNLIDVFVGGFATLLSTYLIYKSKNMLIASLWPVINCVFVSTELYFLLNCPFWMTTFTIALGEFFIMTMVGYPIFKVLFRNKALVKQLKIDKTNIKYLDCNSNIINSQ